MSTEKRESPKVNLEGGAGSPPPEAPYHLYALWLCCTTSEAIWQTLQTKGAANDLLLDNNYVQAMLTQIQNRKGLAKAFQTVREFYLEYCDALGELPWKPPECPKPNQIQNISKLGPLPK